MPSSNWYTYQNRFEILKCFFLSEYYANIFYAHIYTIASISRNVGQLLWSKLCTFLLVEGNWKKAKRRKCCVRHIFKKICQSGHYHILVQEMMLADRENYLKCDFFIMVIFCSVLCFLQHYVKDPLWISRVKVFK